MYLIKILRIFVILNSILSLFKKIGIQVQLNILEFFTEIFTGQSILKPTFYFCGLLNFDYMGRKGGGGSIEVFKFFGLFEKGCARGVLK